MARPCKSADLLVPYSRTKEEVAQRRQNEAKLRGDAKAIKPPKHLSVAQVAIFKELIALLKDTGILGATDSYILAQSAITIDRLQTIEQKINENPELLFDSATLSAKDRYTKDFFRCCNELSLSPQSRAKIGNLSLQAKQRETSPVMKLLNG